MKQLLTLALLLLQHGDCSTQLSDFSVLCELKTSGSTANPSLLKSWICPAPAARTACHQGWHGVKCDERDRVVSLSLIRGSGSANIRLPSSFEKLSRLVNLTMSHSSLTGSLPTQIGYCTSLKNIDLSFNKLTGQLFSGFGNLLSLSSLLLNSNEFSGPIPSSLGSIPNLLTINLSTNGFLGTVPSSLCNLPIGADVMFSGNPKLTCYAQCLSQSNFSLLSVGDLYPCDVQMPINVNTLPTPHPTLGPTMAFRTISGVGTDGAGTSLNENNGLSGSGAVVVSSAVLAVVFVMTITAWCAYGERFSCNNFGLGGKPPLADQEQQEQQQRPTGEALAGQAMRQPRGVDGAVQRTPTTTRGVGDERRG